MYRLSTAHDPSALPWSLISCTYCSRLMVAHVARHHSRSWMKVVSQSNHSSCSGWYKTWCGWQLSHPHQTGHPAPAIKLDTCYSLFSKANQTQACPSVSSVVSSCTVHSKQSNCYQTTVASSRTGSSTLAPCAVRPSFDRSFRCNAVATLDVDGDDEE
jgi:hypothetical protein